MNSSTYANLVEYGSYDLAWLGPIVYPLSLSIITIAYASRDLYRAGMIFKQPHNTAAAAVIGIEAFFAVCCLVQCALNFANRRYVGLMPACDFQGWYATWWVFSSIMMAPVIGWISRAIARNDAVPSAKRIMAVSASVLALAMLISLFPFMGAGRYDFLKDYCMFDMTNKTSGSIYMAVFFICSILTVVHHVQAASALAAAAPVHNKIVSDLDEVTDAAAKTKAGVTMPTFGCLTPRSLQYVMIAWYFIIWLPTGTIVFLYLVKAIEPPASSAISAIIAITLHSQQLFQPLIVGLVWRRWAASSFDQRAGDISNQAGAFTAAAGVPSPSNLHQGKIRTQMV